MALSAYSETNIANSVAVYLAGKLLSAGYLVYWLSQDVVQTPDGWYYNYSTMASTYFHDSTFAARKAAAKGLLTLTTKTTAKPKLAVRPTNDGTVPDELEAAVPTLAVEVGPWTNGDSAGLGDVQRWRSRHLCIYGLAREETEQSVLRDSLAEWFDEDKVLDIVDHDAHTLSAVGDVRMTMVMADSAIVPVVAEAVTFEVVLNSRVVYEA